MNLNEMANKQINTYAQKIITGGDKADEVALGKINFYAVLRRVANNQATLQDLGMLDAKPFPRPEAASKSSAKHPFGSGTRDKKPTNIHSTQLQRQSYSGWNAGL